MNIDVHFCLFQSVVNPRNVLEYVTNSWEGMETPECQNTQNAWQSMNKGYTCDVVPSGNKITCLCVLVQEACVWKRSYPNFVTESYL